MQIYKYKILLFAAFEGIRRFALYIFRKLPFFQKKLTSVPSDSRRTTVGLSNGVKKEKDIAEENPKRIVGVSALSLPHITEKAGLLQKQNQYVFKVIPGATKHGVKDSVQAQYRVRVAKVRMISAPSKSIRVGRRIGERPGYKKAVVTLKEGHKIETSV